MGTAASLLASATVVSLVVVGTAAVGRAEGTAPPLSPPSTASSPAGAFSGVVQDERGLPVAGVVVSALGATTTVAVTDGNGRFQFSVLAPGPYVVRAHLAGYVTPRAQTIHVSAGARATSAIALRRVGSAPPVLTAGLGASDGADLVAPEPEPATSTPAGEQGETAWRIRHSRAGVLKEAAIPADFLGREDSRSAGSLGAVGWTAVDLLGWAVGSPARAATSFFADTPFSGQVNLLTTGTFDSPEQLFSIDSLPRSTAYARVGAPVGEQGDWTVRGALTQADISSWIVAGSYATRAPARHRYDVGLSYSTQRYDGGNVLALRDVTDGSRNVGTVYGYDNFTISPVAALTYGGSYAHYDYLAGRSLVSPRVELTLVPVDKLRLTAAVAQRSLAPGAEEFLPPGDSGIWLPPQRTFSSLERTQPFEAERTTTTRLTVERDLGTSTVALSAFRQNVDGQLVALFGADIPGQPPAQLGHYVVGNAGNADAVGYSATLRSIVAGRVRGSVVYSVSNARLLPASNVHYLMLLAPSAVRPAGERVHDLSTTIETEVPETSTHVMVLYRVGNGFAEPRDGSDASLRPGVDARFDVQVRQSLPFMNFSNARWEMLLAVRNLFREASADQSIYDELMVVRPPKRVVGGVTLRF